MTIPNTFLFFMSLSDNFFKWIFTLFAHEGKKVMDIETDKYLYVLEAHSSYLGKKCLKKINEYNKIKFNVMNYLLCAWHMRYLWKMQFIICGK